MRVLADEGEHGADVEDGEAVKVATSAIDVDVSIGFCLKLGFFGILRLHNPNPWISIPTTRIVGNVQKH